VKYSGLIWSALYRKPIRSVLTLLSIFVAFLLFGLLQSVSFAFSQGANFSGVNRLIVSPKYSIIDSIPLNYTNQIRGIPGIEKIAHQQWFGGIFRDNRSFFPRWAVSKDYLEIYTEFMLPQDQLDAFLTTRTGAVVGRSIAEQYQLKIGDKIPIIPDIWPNKDNGPWEFDLVGIFDAKKDSVGDGIMFINYVFFEEYSLFGEGGAGNIIVQISDPDAAARIASEIDTMFANSSDETKTTSEKVYNQMFAKQMGDIGFIMTSILSAVFFTILLLTGNTMAQAVRERIPELAILKTIGFSNLSMLFIVLAESVFISLLGGLPGLGVARMMMPGLGESVSFLSGLEMTPEIFIQGVTLALLLGIIVGLPSAIRAMRLNIVDALRDS